MLCPTWRTEPICSPCWLQIVYWLWTSTTLAFWFMTDAAFGDDESGSDSPTQFRRMDANHDRAASARMVT